MIPSNSYLIHIKQFELKLYNPIKQHVNIIENFVIGKDLFALSKVKVTHREGDTHTHRDREREREMKID